jgi:hypothetical protein
MNDDDLNKRLREAAEMFSLTCCDEAAERIEQLAGDYAGACNEAADCYIKQCAVEAKLAKAVKALRSYVSKEKGVWNTADAVLAELEKTE